MMDQDDKKHWENIYRTKNSAELSWTQEVPQTSLAFIHNFHLPKTASIIDIGGGDAKLVDFLLIEGFQNITVLDISGEALDRARQRLGSNAAKVKWIEKDITDFEPDSAFDIWHDRAAFHFLYSSEQISKYLSIARKAIKPSGYCVIGTFSKTGPDKCSGMSVRRYGAQALVEEFSNGFEKITCVTEDHITPFHTRQNFLFCSFKRI
jgi:2-polyprenyl-3-methyl-5-hydroxy-6-metoxy-1,4-benzoquinol methylase